uniref:N(4)-(beta-N-acetylglucosaminyl)-L-asparaginase n=1 Tax=Ampulex compressa TaxID=860918 RepID=A0A1W6EW98_AMPCP|nr:(4)-(Beta-N-acetylglucosaminyl)-L-asparaginase [Ampulex compressa]
MKLCEVIIISLIFGIYISSSKASNIAKNKPVVVITWDYLEATKKAWEVLRYEKKSALDAIEASCRLCEDHQCRKTVGYGGSPDESGETTLDAMLMDGVTMDVGGVGGLRNVKNAISVARKVLEHTEHSLLGGDLATKFAVQMGFKEESLQTEESKKMWLDWKTKNCQPNFWKNVVPDPKQSCGPYRALETLTNTERSEGSNVNEENHDTIGVIAIDVNGHIAAGTSTNGARNKIPGRIGDSPIPGAGAYADQKVGAAAATGAGDVMMRFLPSFLAVEEMRHGATPTEAATVAVNRIAEHYPNFVGGVITLNNQGEFGAACNGMPRFAHFVADSQTGKPVQHYVTCNTPQYSVVSAK